MSDTSSLPAWSGGDGSIIYQSDDHEPSGMAFIDIDDHTYLYMVGDDGHVLRRRADSSSWESESYGNDDDHDFESIATVKNKLMVGVEGGVLRGDGSYTYPRIRRFDPTGSDDDDPIGDFTGSNWKLKGMPIDDDGGMEAIAFIPQGDAPSEWGEATYYDGFFLVAVQSRPGKIYVYDLPQGKGDDHDVDAPIASFRDDLLDLKISDMCYVAEKQRLVVLYDDKASKKYPGNGKSDFVGALQVLKLESGEFIGTLAMRTEYVGSEGVAYHNGDLYIGLDQKEEDDDSDESQWDANDLKKNLLLKYKNFDLP